MDGTSNNLCALPLRAKFVGPRGSPHPESLGGNGGGRFGDIQVATGIAEHDPHRRLAGGARNGNRGRLPHRQWRVQQPLAPLKRAYLKVDLALTELPPLRQVEAVLAGQLDVGYSPNFEYSQEGDLAVDSIASWPWLVAMRSGHPLDKRAAITAKVLLEEPFIVYAAHTADDGQVKLLRRLLKTEPRVSYHVPNTLTVLTLTAAGMGLALVPAPWEAVNVIPNLVYRPIAELTLACNLVLLSRGNDASPAIRQFVEMARQSGGSL